jgi:lysophospholipase L1-like esterase
MSGTAAKKTPVWFYLTLPLVPVLVLVLLEMLLRFTGLTKPIPLFVPAPGISGYLTPNPELIQRYVPHPALAPDVSPDSWYFPAEKADGTLRIVVQGESSAAGFPYGRFGSPAAMLQQRLKRLYPEKNIEVISVAMAAISSFTLVDTAEEILAIEPDAILIYAGHNEYLGVMGAGSSLASSSSPHWGRLLLWLRQFSLFQILQMALSPTGADAKPQAGTMMSKAAAGQHIAFDSALYQQGLAQFEQNMGLLLETYQQAAVPVFIGTLVSNEADQPPFAAEPGLAQLPHLSKLNQQPQLSEAQLQQLLLQHPQQAQLHFYLAKLWLKQGKTQQARQAFQLARDYDLLRFRAPSAFNRIIRQLAASHQAIVVETEDMLRAQSPQQILGQQLLLEHVHPNAEGYFWLAQSYLQQLITTGLLPEPAQPIENKLRSADLPLTQTDLLLADYKIRQLKAFYPFSQQNQVPEFGPRPDKVHQLAFERSQGLSWLDASQQLLEYYQQQKQPAEAAKVAGLLFDSLPDQHQVAYVAGQLYFAAEDLPLAIYYQLRAVELAPAQLNYRMMLARSYFFAGKLEQSIAQLEQVLQQDPQHQAAKQQLQRIGAIKNQQRS